MRHLFRNICIAGLSLLLSITFAELVLRQLFPLNPINSYRFDKLLGHRRPANLSGYYTTSEFRTEISFNSLGFRSAEWSIDKAPGAFRIAFVGDSYIEGLQVSEQDLVSQQVLQRLEKNGASCGELVPSSYEVLNFGVSGYGTTQEFLVIREHVLQYHPDLIILGFLSSNDIKNNSLKLDQGTDDQNSAYRPYFFHHGAGNWSLRPPNEKMRAIIERSGFQHRVLDSSKLIELVYRTLSRLSFTSELLVRLGLLSRGAYETLNGIPTDYSVYDSSLTPEWQEAWEATAVSLSAIDDLTQSAGVPVLVFLIPNREQVYPEYWQALVQKYPLMQSVQSWDLTLPNRIIAERLAHSGLHLVDPIDRFRNLARQNVTHPLYFASDGHFTPFGHRYAAESIFEYAKEAGLFCPTSH